MMRTQLNPPFEPAVVGSVVKFLESLGLNLSVPGLKGTPLRIMKSMRELLSGLYEPPPKLTVFPNDERYDEVVLLKDIRVVSMCEHHFLPFIGRAHVGYIPKDSIVGVSKLSRLVNWLARRPQVQERLTQQVADYLQKNLKPKGVMVVIEARHMCMSVRGVQEDQAVMVTSAMKGAFKEGAARAEFMSLIGRK